VKESVRDNDDLAHDEVIGNTNAEVQREIQGKAGRSDAASAAALNLNVPGPPGASSRAGMRRHRRLRRNRGRL